MKSSDSCPLCGQNNQCNSASFSSDTGFSCWCQSIRFTDEQRAQIRQLMPKNSPEIDPSCICPDCARKIKQAFP